MNDRNRLRTLGPSPASPFSAFVSFLLSSSFFFRLFSFRIPTLASSMPVARPRQVVLCALCARKKHSFILPPPALHLYLSLSLSLSSSLRLSAFYRRLSLFQFYIVSIVVVTSRRFDYASHSTVSLVFAADSAANHDHVPCSK